MHRLFPPALVACINEGRLPGPGEVAVLADKILAEAFSSPECPGNRDRAVGLAFVALTGSDPTAATFPEIRAGAMQAPASGMCT